MIYPSNENLYLRVCFFRLEEIFYSIHLQLHSSEVAKNIKKAEKKVSF